MDPDANVAPRDSAPYGKACAGCAKAKCRCVPRGAGLACERCRRLQTECRPSAVVRKRQARRAPRATSAALLGEKLDDLVAMLKAQSGAAHWGISGQRAPSGTASRGSADGSASEQYGNQLRQRSGTASESPGLSPTYYLTPQTATPPLPQEPSPSQAEQYLYTFRTNHMRVFPFIYIPPDMTATQLRRERPFLWLTIRASCCKPLEEQVALEKRIREVSAQKLLVDLEQSMDLLLGLLTFLSWAGEKYRGKPVLSAFSGLASALLSDLRLDRHVQELSHREVNVCRDYGFPIKFAGSAGIRTNEDRRAVLGCYIVTTCFSCFLKTPSATKWTPYIEDCLRHLSHDRESSDDEVLVTIARTFKIIDDVVTARPSRQPESETWQSPNPPPMLLIKALRANLEEIRRTTSQETLKNKVIISYLLATEAMINELALYPADRPAVAPGCADFGRTECFHACLLALTHFLDNWFSFAPGELPALPMPLHMLPHRCLYILYRLALTDDPAWDRAAVAGSVDVLAALDRCADMYGAVPRAVGLETDGSDMYSRVASVLRGTVAIWRKTLEEAGVMGGGAVGGTEVVAGVQEFPAMDLALDDWFNDTFPTFNPF